MLVVAMPLLYREIVLAFAVLAALAFGKQVFAVQGVPERVSLLTLRELEENAWECAKSIPDPVKRLEFLKEMRPFQNSLQFLDTSLEFLQGLEGEFPKDSLARERAARESLVQLAEGKVDEAINVAAGLTTVSQLEALRDLTRYCVENGHDDWADRILESLSSRPTGEHGQSVDEIDVNSNSVRLLILRDRGLRKFVSGDSEGAGRLAIESIARIVDQREDALVYGVVAFDARTLVELAERCGLMKEAYQVIRPRLLNGTLFAFEASDVARWLARTGLKQELAELREHCETDEKWIDCSAAAAVGFAEKEVFADAIQIVHEVLERIREKSLSFPLRSDGSNLVAASFLAGEGALAKELAQRMLQQYQVEEKYPDNWTIACILQQADPELAMPLLDRQGQLTRCETAMAFARSCKRTGKEDLARTWLEEQHSGLKKVTGSGYVGAITGIGVMRGDDLSRTAVACGWAILGDLAQVDSLLGELAKDNGNEFLRAVANQAAQESEPGMLVDWAGNIEDPVRRAHAFLGLFQGFAERNHRLDGWFPR